MYTLFVIIHVLVSIVLCISVLLQSSKGGGLAGAFGGSGGAPQQLLGSRGMTTLLHKITIWCGIAFMVTSLMLFMMSGTRSSGAGSVLQNAQQSGDLGTQLPAAPIQDPGAPVQDAGDQPAPTGGGEQTEQTDGGDQ